MQIIFLFLLKNASCLSYKERILLSSLVWVGDYKKNISESISLWPVTEAVSAKRGRKVNTGKRGFLRKKLNNKEISLMMQKVSFYDKLLRKHETVVVDNTSSHFI